MDLIQVFFLSFVSFFLSFVSLIHSSVQSTDQPFVTCGSVVKLVNVNYRVRLHSHDIKYGSGSGQQSVTGVDESEDANSYWQVKEAMNSERSGSSSGTESGAESGRCVRGIPVKCGSSVRFQHLNTGKNLHSHLFSSPLSGNQEVSAFGEDGTGDTGDNWIILCSGDYWEREETIRLKHADTEKWLTVTGRTYGRPINGQLEIVGSGYSDSSCYWKVAEGVYIKPDDGSKVNQSNNDGHDEL